MIKNKKKNGFYHYKFYLLVMLEFIMAFSSFGYIRNPDIYITLMHIPVILGAMLLGVKESMLIAGIFGLTSIWQAAALAVTPTDLVFSPFTCASPVKSILLSMGTRILFGFVSGIVFVFARKYIKKNIAFFSAILSSFCALFHTAIVYFCLRVLFPDVSEYAIAETGRFSPAGLLINLLLTATITFVAYMMNQSHIANRLDYITTSSEIKYTKGTYILMAGYLSVFLLLLTGLIYHFNRRANAIFDLENITLSYSASARFVQIELQLLTALLAVGGIVLIIFLLSERYIRLLTNEAKRDTLTGLYNKRAMEQFMNKAFASKFMNSKSVFLMLDVDHFKEINDTYGHPFGDIVLEEVAELLKSCFSQKDIIARMGGDEFWIFCQSVSHESDLTFTLNRLLTAFHELSIDDHPAGFLHCSIGAAYCCNKKSFEALYQAADTQLYRAKEGGRNQYQIEEML